MNILDIITGPVFKIIDKLIPDPTAKAQAQLDILKLNQAGEFKEIEADLARSTAQTDINKIEAASSNLFVSGWRPAIGWVCVLAFITQYFILPLVSWLATIKGLPAPPKLDLGDLIVLAGGMLGLGTLRSIDKKNGVA